MPTNKNAQLRYQVLDRCFRDSENLYSLEDLLDRVNEKMAEMGCGKVTDRTIKADIKFMRDSEGYNAPIRTYKICDSYRGIVWCYRYDVVGVSFMESAEIAEIRLKFSENRFPYVVTKPLHKSQKVIDAENHIISIKVRWNAELDQMIFAYGPDVEVLEPQWYREYFKGEVEKIFKRYFEAGR